MPRTCFRAYQVTEALDQPMRQHGAPKTLRCDNHPQFADRALVQWAYWNRVELAFSKARNTN